MSEYDAGSIFTNIVPSFRGVQTQISKNAKEWGKTVQTILSDSISKGIQDGLDKGTEKSLPQSTKDGDKTGSTFADAFKKRLSAALKSLPKAEIDGDTKKVDKKVQEIRDQLKELSGKTIGVDIDAKTANATLDKLSTKLANLARKSPNVQVRVDAAKAAAELAAFTAEVNKLDGRKVNVQVAKQGLQSFAQAGSSISLMTLAIPALGIAAIPVLAAVTAGALALGGALAGALLGIVALAAVAVPAFQHITKATKDQAAAQKKLATAQAAVTKAQQGVTAAKTKQQASAQKSQAAATKKQASASTALAKAQKAVSTAQARVAGAKTPSAKKAATAVLTTAKGRLSTAQKGVSAAGAATGASIAGSVAATQKLATANKNLAAAKAAVAKADAETTPQEKLLNAAMKDAKTAFADWAKVLEPQVVPLLTAGIKLLNPVLKAATPLVKGAASGVSLFLTDLSAFVSSPWFAKLASTFGSMASQSIPALGIAFLNIVHGLGNVLTAFRPFTTVILSGLDNVTQKFAVWSDSFTKSSGFKSFMQYVTTNGPKVFKFLGDVASAVVHVVTALAPFGPPLLAGFDALADVVKKLPPNVIRGIAIAIGGVLVVMKGAGAVNTFAGALKGVGTAAGNVKSGIKGIGNVISTSGSAIGGFATTLGGFAKTGAATALSGVKTGIVNIASAIGSKAKVIAGFISSIVTMGVQAGTTALAFLGLKLAQLGSAIASGIATAAQWLLNTAVGVFEILTAPITITIFAIIAAIALLAFGIFELVTHWNQVWAAIKSVTLTVVHFLSSLFSGWWTATKIIFTKNLNAIGKFFSDKFHSMVSTAQTVLGKLSGIASKIWGDVKSAFDSGINLVIGAINWLLDKIDSVLKFFGIKAHLHIDPIGESAPAARQSNGASGGSIKLATGGGVSGPGTGTSDSIPAMLSDGEFVVNAKSTSQYLPLLHSLNNSGLPGHATGGLIGGIPGYSIGGIVGSIGRGIGGAASAVGHGISDAASWIGGSASGIWKSLSGAFSGLLGGAMPMLKNIGIGTGKKAVSGALSKIGSFFSSSGGAGKGSLGGGGVARWAPTILQALSLLHQPATWLPTVERRMNQESGGNPNAINLWDSNAKAGHPSQGLMQTIPGTFAAYAGPFQGLGILNPLANTYAGLNYALHRYGSLAALNRPGGYATGGLVGQLFDTGGVLSPGPHHIMNASRKPEAILTNRQWSDVSAIVHNQLRGGGGSPQVVQNVYPSTGLSEQAVAAIAAQKIQFAMR